jgi:phenylpyruvate tautomerase PptA (4-oxalocrotonate tautomerase family)
MPILTINTNVSKDKVSLDHVKKLVDVVAQALGKPKEYVVVHINPGQLMSFAGGDAPCAIGRLGSIGQINREKNKATQAAIATALEQELEITDENFFLTFEDLPPANSGWKKTTFAEILG